MTHGASDGSEDEREAWRHFADEWRDALLSTVASDAKGVPDGVES